VPLSTRCSMPLKKTLSLEKRRSSSFGFYRGNAGCWSGGEGEGGKVRGTVGRSFLGKMPYLLLGDKFCFSEPRREKCI
jgi:hypothetical protein